jgi:hypothetical protein
VKIRQAFGIAAIASLFTVAILGTMGQVHVRGIVPSGLVAFYNGTSCPAGWAELTQARGRYIVGRTVGGTNLAQVGTALTDQENRPAGAHRHSFSLFNAGDGGQVHSAATSNVGTFETGDGGLVAGTPAPYVQLTACQKS